MVINKRPIWSSLAIRQYCQLSYLVGMHLVVNIATGLNWLFTRLVVDIVVCPSWSIARFIVAIVVCQN